MSEYTVSEAIKKEMIECRDVLEKIIESGVLTYIKMLHVKFTIRAARAMTKGTCFSERFNDALVKVENSGDDESWVWKGLYEALEAINDYLAREVTE